jgi:hypothetical protein
MSTSTCPPIRTHATSRVALTVVAVFTAAILSSGVAAAHEGHNHRIMGTVTMAAADHVMVKSKDGKDVTVKVTKNTKVRSKPALKVEEIRAGTRVLIVAAQEKDKSFTAKTIEVGAAPANGK